MKKIEPFDVERMLFGEAPPIFLLEVFFRALILFLFMLFIMRLLGKRMAGELTVTEMVLMVTLGGSVAVAIQVPEGGALIGFVVLTCALLFERGLSILTAKNRKLEVITQGKASLLIKDGVMMLDNIKDVNVTRQQLFAALRKKQINQLGKVERLYLEASGTFSLYTRSGKAPAGLAVFPDDDKTILETQEISKETFVCFDCGMVAKDSAHCCNSCSSETRVKAIL